MRTADASQDTSTAGQLATLQQALQRVEGRLHHSANAIFMATAAVALTGIVAAMVILGLPLNQSPSWHQHPRMVAALSSTVPPMEWPSA